MKKANLISPADKWYSKDHLDINLNQTVEIQLTDAGVNRLKEIQNQINNAYFEKGSDLKVSEHGPSWRQIRLWRLFELMKIMDNSTGKYFDLNIRIPLD